MDARTLQGVRWIACRHSRKKITRTPSGYKQQNMGDTIIKTSSQVDQSRMSFVTIKLATECPEHPTFSALCAFSNSFSHDSTLLIS